MVLSNSSKNNSIDFSIDLQSQLDELNTTRVVQLEQVLNSRPRQMSVCRLIEKIPVGAHS